MVDEEAVGEMLSFFPARDVEEPVTKEFVRAELVVLRSEVQAEIAATRAEVKDEIAATRAEMKAEIAATRAELKDEISELERRLADGLRAEIRRSVLMNAAMIITFGGVLIGALRL